MLPSALARHPDMKGKSIRAKHPSTFTKTHTCARLHTTVRGVAFISQNKVSLWSRGLKKKTEQQQKLYLMSNCGEKRINTQELARPHDKYVADLGKRAQNTGRHAESEGKKENPTILFLAAEPQSGFYEKLHPVLHLCGRRSSARALLLA